ncbi:MAG: response regulator [Acidobacteria bacterium]|nr:response regulator [Acidobacteriota bacterium]
MAKGEGDGFRRKTVLVVDDYDGARRITARALEMFGYRAVEAAGGEEAVELARREMPDLILMDLSMPNLDGFAAMYSIRRLIGLRDVPFIIVSAHTSPEIHADALAFGCADFITKPFELEILRAAIVRQLERDDATSESANRQTDNQT